jgi:photosystem II stability/assembly factor-like uncharacterized protein
VEDVSLRIEFHRALDAIAPPAPWLGVHVREDLRRRRHMANPPHHRRAWFNLTLPRLSTPLVAGVLIVALAVTAAGAFLAVNNYAHRSVPIRPHSGAVLRMCSQGQATNVVGWSGTTAISEVGAALPSLSPPNIPGQVKGGSSICVLDADHAWMSVATGNPNCPGTPPCAGPQIDHVVVQSTIDGGQTWQEGQPVPASGTNLAAELDFLDDLHGWLLIDTGYYASPAFVRTLYATTDGGLHWSRLTSGAPSDRSGLGQMAVGCAESGMMFVSADRGWLTWNCSASNGPAPAQSGGPVVAATIDGGLSWAAVDLPGICGATAPIFSGNRGVLQSMCGVYWTTDSGRTWNAGQALPSNAEVDFVDGATGFYFQRGATGSDLYRTNDGGRSWTVVTKGLFSGDNIDSYQFIDAKTGFASTSKSPATWKTTDGGKTWLLPAAYRSIGNVVCPLPWNPPALGSVPVPVKMVSPTTGWAAGALRTTDDGSHWSSAGPRPLPDRSSGHSEFFLDGAHAWVAQAVGSSTACADQVVVFSTADGGRTWQQGQTIGNPLPDRNALQAGTWSPFLDFLDGQHGWLFVQANPNCGVMGCAVVVPGSLYRTSDGGRHWALVSSEAGLNSSECRSGSAVYFSSTTTGWLECTFGSVLVTRDGGATWAMQLLVSEPCCQDSLPTFFDENHGMYFDSSVQVLLMTSDGGVTWSPHRLPPLLSYPCTGKYGPTTCSDEAIAAVSFINTREGWAAVSKANADGTQVALRIEHTIDGGQTWTSLSGNLPPASTTSTDLRTATLSFVDASNGFWWIPASQTTTPEFLRTTDGGHTWAAVQMTFNS